MKLTFLGAAGTVTGSVTHGEAVPADTLRREIQDGLGYSVHVPEYLESIQLA